jgi:hypothetical protein
MSASPSGLGVPLNPAWVGVIRRAWLLSSAANCSAKPLTVSGPPPPCSSRTGWPSPVSVIVTSTGPVWGTATVTVVLVVLVVLVLVVVIMWFSWCGLVVVG